jgi:hypothetical protein
MELENSMFLRLTVRINLYSSKALELGYKLHLELVDFSPTKLTAQTYLQSQDFEIFGHDHISG